MGIHPLLKCDGMCAHDGGAAAAIGSDSCNAGAFGGRG